MRHLFKKTAALLILYLLIMTGVSQAYAAGREFPDMTGHWAGKYVNMLAGEGIISGMPDGNFHPNIEVTTCQFVTMIIRSNFGEIAPTGKHWASGYLDKAKQLNVIADMDISNADVPLDRRIAARIGYDALVNIFGESDEIDVTVAERLGDLYACRSCVSYIAQIYTKGIMIGYPDSMFYGQKTLTRAEAATIVSKILKKSLREPQYEPGSPITEENGKISPEETKQVLSSNKDAILIDVRAEDEFALSRIPGSINIPLTDLVENLTATMIPTDKSTVIIVYCQDGTRSLKAYYIMKEAGYSNVHNLGGVQDWPYEISYPLQEAGQEN